jgi:hypothetical protein
MKSATYSRSPEAFIASQTGQGTIAGPVVPVNITSFVAEMYSCQKHLYAKTMPSLFCSVFPPIARIL